MSRAAGRLYAGAIAVAVLATALGQTPLSEDGSDFVFQVLHHQALVVPHGRYVDGLLELPLLFASKLTSDLLVLRAVYSSTFALLPALSLGLCWLLVRKRNPRWFLWPALWIGIILLPGLTAPIFEATIAEQLAWPLLLVTVMGLEGRRLLALGVALAALVLLLHPISLGVLGITAATAIVVSVRARAWRLRLWAWAAGLLGAATVATLIAHGDRYDAASFTVPILTAQYRLGVFGFPLLAATLAWMGGLAALLATTILRKPGSKRLAQTACLLALAGILIAMLLWASSPPRWQYAYEYRLWAFFLSIPLYALFLADVLLVRREDVEESAAKHGSERQVVVAATGIVLASVLAVHAMSWSSLVMDLQKKVSAAPGPCVAPSEAGPRNTARPLEHSLAGDSAPGAGSASPGVERGQLRLCRRHGPGQSLRQGAA